ncbi:putative metal dependent phosphohydrolase [Pseudomonas phage vB_PpS_SYP]|nr:putative metal dependent phosphohydrolase [Pseudomonas phage vB_PpS_SYP]
MSKSQMTIALELALEHHKDQKYGDKPYIYHLAQVDNLVVQVYKPKGLKNTEPYSKAHGDEMDQLRAIAFLHDIIEDTHMTFGCLCDAGVMPEVAAAVYAMSKCDGESYDDYIARVMSNDLARKVKLCDTSANLMNSIMEGRTKNINKYTKQIQLLGGF